MSVLDEFQANLEALPNLLQKKYELLRNLDTSLQKILRQNEQRCEHEILEIKRGIKEGKITPDTSAIRFSDEALEEQKHSIRVADEKVALATQAYDLVDAHILELDQYLKKFDEDLRRERESVAATPVPTSSDGSAKSGRGGESGGGGRKKTRLATAGAGAGAGAVAVAATAGAVAAELGTTAGATSSFSTGMELDLPVDPSEPTYCFCNQVSYGDMVGCDNVDCKIEWFHFGCVGLKEKPRGKWYCPNCAPLKNRRKGR